MAQEVDQEVEERQVEGQAHQGLRDPLDRGRVVASKIIEKCHFCNDLLIKALIISKINKGFLFSLP